MFCLKGIVSLGANSSVIIRTGDALLTSYQVYSTIVISPCLYVSVMRFTLSIVPYLILKVPKPSYTFLEVLISFVSKIVSPNAIGKVNNVACLLKGK